MSLRKTCLISFFFFFFFFLIPSLIQLTNADPRVEIVYKECRKDHAQNMSQYLESYSKVVNDIQEQMQRNKFGFAAAGESPNRLYVLSQCLDDLSNEECATCFTDIRTVFPGCFPSTGGRVYLDGCFIRGENYSFYREALSPLDYKICSDVQDDSKSFNNLARSLISELIKRVPKNNNYADGHEKSLNESVCAMANCLRTLDENSCSSCLKNAAKSALACLPSTEGRVLNAGCFLRYADYGFVNNPKIHAVQDAVFSFAVYVIVAIVVCLMAIAVGIFVGRIVYERLNRQQQSNLSALDIDSSLFKRSLNFNYSTLEKATEYFSEANKLGQGGYGEVFKGTLADGREIAVKRLFIRGENHTQDVYNEMDVISRAEHKNLVRLLGCSITSRASLLVYEFLVNKSLDCTLFDPEKKKELDWKKRLGIIIGTAQGLEYLHKDCQVRIVHRDIKASNILLDSRHRPKIADFGLARFHSSDRTLVSTVIAGTLGYMAPEYLARGRLTEKVDVYSYGVLVLEIISGMQNNKFQNNESLDTLVTTAWKHFQSDMVSQIIDESMEVDDVEEILRVVQVGLLCTQESPSRRPTMTRIIEMLTEKDLHLPSPSKPPFIDEWLEISHSLSSSHRESYQSPSSCKLHSRDHDPR